MKSRGHILGSLFLTAMFSMAHLALGQEEGFNIPSLDMESENRSGGSTSGEGNDLIDPVKKTSKTGDDKKTSKKEDSETSTQPQKQLAPAKEHLQEKISDASNPDNSPKSDEENMDESVLSFNFLYYMIQKFKFSDVIDQ